MKKKYFILFTLFVSGKTCFSQIYGVGNGDGFSYDCYTQADNPFTLIYKTGNGGDKMIDCITWGQLVTLPKTFLSFDAFCDKNKVNLYWSASNQTNSNNFSIERTTDKIHFTTVGTVPVLQNSNQKNYYWFADNNVLPGNFYYRLKQIKTTGQFEFSPIVSANCKKDITESVTVYPNPTNGIINVIDKETITSLVVKNLLGKTLIIKKINTVKATVNIAQLPQGMYYVEVNTSRNTTYCMVSLIKN